MQDRCTRIAYGGAGIVLGIIALGIWGDRFSAWAKKLNESEKVRAEEWQLARKASEEEAAERQRIRAVADREMDRLATERRRSSGR